MAKARVTNVLVDLQAVLEGTTIFDIPPNSERWEDGLESLDKARQRMTKIKAALEHTPSAPRALVMDVARVHGLLSDFVRLRDHFRAEHSSGGGSHNWSQRHAAERQLEELQRRVADLRSRIRTGEYSLDNGKALSMEWRWFSVGAVMLLAALVFAGWGFSLRRLEYDQRRILLWVLPLASGFAASAFAGSFSVKARNWIPGLLISATGGFGVWLISFFLLFPKEGPSQEVVGPLVGETPISLPNKTDPREALRKQHKVRRLEERENGLPISALPKGVYGFDIPWANPSRDRTLSRDSGGTAVLEVHKLRNGSVMLVGFVSKEDASKLAGSTVEVQLFPSPWEGATRLVAIPVQRITEFSHRSEFRDVLDLKLVALEAGDADSPFHDVYLAKELEIPGSRDFQTLEYHAVTGVSSQTYSKGVFLDSWNDRASTVRYRIPRGAKYFVALALARYAGVCGGGGPQDGWDITVSTPTSTKSTPRMSFNYIDPVPLKIPVDNIPSGKSRELTLAVNPYSARTCDEPALANARFTATDRTP